MHHVHCGTTNPPPPYAEQLTTSLQLSDLDPVETYYWRIDESNSAGTTTGIVWNFTTGAGPTSAGVTTMSVDTSNAGRGQKKGQVEIIILNNEGGPVEEALVEGNFTGDFTDLVSGNTDSNGIVILETENTKKGNINFEFCISEVTNLDTLTWDGITPCSSF